jgi:hypothetical protein
MFTRIITILALTTSALLLFVVAPSAHAAEPTFKTYRLSGATNTQPIRRVVSFTEYKGARMTVKFNNGARWSVGACQVEDSERCFLDATRRGNGQGNSFVRMFHRTFYITIR